MRFRRTSSSEFHLYETGSASSTSEGRCRAEFRVGTCAFGMGNLRWMKLLTAALILPTAFVLAIAAFETQIFYPPPSHAPTKGIVWRGHTFATRGEFARWLRSRGVRYRVWARRHPSLAGVAANRRAHPSAKQAAKARRSRKGSDWSLENLGGGAAVLASLSFGIVLVRRRRRGGRGGSETQIQLAARRTVPAAKGGARLTLRWPKATTLLSSSFAVSSANAIRRRRGELALYLATGLLAVGLGLVVTAWLNGV
jgi:hypothetical protein